MTSDYRCIARIEGTIEGVGLAQHQQMLIMAKNRQANDFSRHAQVRFPDGLLVLDEAHRLGWRGENAQNAKKRK